MLASKGFISTKSSTDITPKSKESLILNDLNPSPPPFDLNRFNGNKKAITPFF